MNTKIKLTPELETQILAAIRAGGFPHVAAQAFGVPQELFEKWLDWGEKSQRQRQPWFSFAKKVRQAQAIARLNAEMKCHEEDPRLWLRSGPGKETPNSAGWTTIVRPQVQSLNTVTLFTSPDFLQFMGTLRNVLAPYPDALQALTKALDSPQETKPVKQVEG